MKPKKLKPKPRKTLAKKIAALADASPAKALALANYGHDGESVSRKLTERNPKRRTAIFRKHPASLSDFIQDWLFIEAQRTDPALRAISDSQDTAVAQNNLEIETGQLFADRITARDSDFFRDFADLLDEAIKFRDDATGRSKDGIRSELLANKLAGKITNLSEVARVHGTSVRTVWEINKEIGAPTVSRGRPRK